MYRVLKNGKEVARGFKTYEQARSFARSFIRQLFPAGSKKRAKLRQHLMETGYYWDGVSRNPPALEFFNIKVVKAA